MSTKTILATIAISTFLTACDGGPVKAGPVGGVKQRRGNLKSTVKVPDFMFLEAQERPIRRKDLLGKVWLCSFVFTHCPTHCVEIAREMRKLQEEYRKEDDFRLVAITVDPARDTPKRLRTWGKDWEVDPQRWYLLTGKRRDIVEFAMSGLKTGIDPKEPLNHSVYFALVDKAGTVRDYYNVRDVDRMKRLRKDVETLLAETPPQ